METRQIVLWSILAAVATASGCSGCDESALPAPASAQLNWKRSAVLERDLAAALDLPRDELCTGPDEKQCITELYLVALGGNDPIEAALYEPVSGPLVTTPSAVDRVMFSACAKRTALDSEAETPVVFTSLDLGGAAPSADSVAVAETATTLFRRFHGRDPDAAEIELVGLLTVTDDGASVDASSFATIACYAVGSTSEFLFF